MLNPRTLGIVPYHTKIHLVKFQSHIAKQFLRIFHKSNSINYFRTQVSYKSQVQIKI